ncbi:hypothetical protein A2774_04075 [Candidatus Roizmanbacteria bacterium RIFCSPHIGHO2_01_FULL_39_12c]|uniref:Uncharacterized protein n=1 Tax=Candidatus Roizmanbacteria bacterium RIFCSPHIGHO2_01_FULL_39_12c TaxID=1802031 RepID=A0A1F7GEL6_9BACT|nr:MAG: hypothetical protein A2774_04075 [Candidatus Roizmanbacteria bacterium RIFCSPHIGHO2_01_FULL_39_12c]OGK48073.1 MAG: hypothetical protein A2963_03890 [Candidatus Roizmanbacteria bacterium RIFCSPLOWO2_01_FULL_40_13]
MVHLSKYYLDKEKLRRLYQLFFELISRSANKDNFLLITCDFISPPEQINFQLYFLSNPVKKDII